MDPFSPDRVAFRLQFTTAIRAGDVTTLRELLAPEEEQDNGRLVATEKDIHLILYDAACHGCVESCRLLWARLSPSGKHLYTRDAYNPELRFDPFKVALDCGHVEVVRLFIQEFKFNVNQMDFAGDTPLVHAARALRGEEMCRLLLDAGAEVNRGKASQPYCGPLFAALYWGGDANVVRLLLDRGADPNLGRKLACQERITDVAIRNGRPDILQILLEHGALVGRGQRLCSFLTAPFGPQFCGSLNTLLYNERTSRESKLDTLRLLIRDGKVNIDTAAFIQYSFTQTIKVAALAFIEDSELFLQAGMDPNKAMYCAVQEGGVANEPVCRWLVQHGDVDPFLEHAGDDVNDERHAPPTATPSPFQVASRQADNTSIFEYFLGLWDERFSSNGGKNSDGDYPIHVVCCEPLVSLQAIHLLVNCHPNALAVVDGEQGLLPFHFAANRGASLDVIFYLLQHFPVALRHVGNSSSSMGRHQHHSVSTGVGPTGPTVETSNGDDDDDNSKQDGHQQHSGSCGPAKKKAKIMD